MTPELVVTNVDAWLSAGSWRGGVDIVVQSGRIAAIRPTAPGADYGCPTIDGSGATAIPGLCDLHVHLTTNSDFTRPLPNPVYRATVEKPEKLLHGIRNGIRALRAGFTTLRVIGHRDVGEVNLRDFIQGGLMTGPRLFVAPWWISMTGGHGDMMVARELRRRPFDTADGVDECRKMVRLQARQGADFIKVMASGGLGSDGDDFHTPNYSLQELTAIVVEAHDLGLKVAAHAYSGQGIKRALLAGVDTLEHGTYLDEECLELMVANGTFLVPTLSIYDWVAEDGQRRGASAEFMSVAEQVRRRSRENLLQAVAAGVPVAMGTDTSGTLCPSGKNARELELYVEVGMSPEEALVTATQTAAAALGWADRLGRLEVGYLADIVLVNGNPLADIGLLGRPGGLRCVIKEGSPVTERGF